MDQTLMGKIKKPKESLKNYFYFVNKTKFELFEPPVDTDQEIIEKLKKIYIENSEEIFIDELIFSQLENLSKINSIIKKYNDIIRHLRGFLVQKTF